jgi:RNA polymerase sigma-70 factor (ECF subfamily)
LPAEPATQDEQFAALADPYRSELLAHCYRLVGSLHDAEDLVQETLVRAWRGYGNFDGRSSLRTWLYRIATNTCLTALSSRHRRVLPSGLGPGTEDSAHAHLQRADHVPWLEPVPTADLVGPSADPAAVVALRDSTRLALIAAYQSLPARQRAVLILVDVVGYTPAEVADLLDVTVTAARSLLQRARATVAGRRPAREPASAPELDADLLGRYLRAFEAGDTAAIAKLLKADVEYEMPPHPVWFLGRDAVVDHYTRRVFTHPHRARLTSANGYPALATYSRVADGSFSAHGIQVLEPEDGLIARATVFIDENLFARFGLPLTLPPR